jgi:DNA polymerase III subunit delta
MPPPIKSDDLWAQWSRQLWKPHYLFAGQEDFLIDQAVERALVHWLGESPETLSLERLDAEIQSLDDIVQAVQTMPFFAGQRVLRIQNAGQLTAVEQERLVEVLAAAAPETHCLFLWGKEWRREEAQKPLPRAFSDHGQAVIFWTPYPEQAQRWLLERAKHYKKTISPQAAAWLVLQSGEGLRLLDQELAKCACYVGERPAIELENVQASFGYQKAGSPFDWTASIRQRNGPAALRILNQLLKEGEEPIRLLALVSRTLRDWLGTKGSGENAALLAMRFRLKRGEEGRFVQELGRWSEDVLAEGIKSCVETEQAIKSGKETPEMAMTLLTLGLCGGEPVHVTR